MINLESKRLIIFDLDGTLVDAYGAVLKSLNYVLRKLKMPLADDTVKSKVGFGMRHLLSQYFPEDKLDWVIPIYSKHHVNSIKANTKCLPFVRYTLKKLRKDGYKLAIATNRPAFAAKEILKVLKIENFFDYAVYGDTAKELKPSPWMINDILKKLKVSNKEAVFVGDMGIDAQTGRNAKVSTVCVLTGSSLRSEIEKAMPDAIINNIKELFQM